jgi:hypothetical protein
MLVPRLSKTLISNHNLITELSLVYLSRLVSTSCAGHMETAAIDPRSDQRLGAPIPFPCVTLYRSQVRLIQHDNR